MLEEFERRGWLSEQRALEQLVHARRGKFGSGRIRQELLSKGIAEDAVARTLPQLKDGDLVAARAVWTKKFGSVARNAQERARQIRFLQGRGFALEIAMRIIKGGGEDE